MSLTSPRFRGVAVLCTGALLLAGCGGSSSSSDSGGGSGSGGESGASPSFGIIGDQKACDSPTQGGTLTLADYSEARSLSPAKTIATGYSGGTALAALYDVLVRYDVTKDEFVPQLAEDVTSNDDYTEWTVTLRDGVTFSDGTPLDADAVVNSVNWYLGNGGYDAGVVKPFLTSVTATDPKTVTFALNTSWATFSAMLGQGIGFVVAPAAIATEEFQPIGAGPFTFGSYAPQENLILNAREDYWDGKPNLETLKFVFLNADATRVDTLDSGGVDVVVLRGNNEVKSAKDAGYPGYLSLADLGSTVFFNAAEGRPGADPRVRKAIDLAVDPEVLNQRVYDGQELASKRVFPEESQWYAGDVKVNDLDVAEAKKLVAEAKADGWDGTIGYLGGDDPIGQNAALSLQAMLKNVGIDLQTELVRTVADRIQRIFVTRDYDMAINAISVTEENPWQRLYGNLYSTSASNVLGYNDPKMDALIDELQGEAGQDRADTLAGIEAEFQDSVPMLPLAPATPFAAWQKDVHGIVPINEGMLTFADASVGECG